MKTPFLLLLTAVMLAGCVVIPAGPAAPYPARAYVGPPAVVLVPPRPYPGYGHPYYHAY